MNRSLPGFALALLFLVACSTSRPPAEAAIDPVTDPSIVGAVDEAVLEGAIQAEAAAATGRRIGRVAGVIAAVLGGPESESVDDAIDRYRRTRDTAEAVGAVIGATQGAVEGAERGYELDVQFAELHAIEGIEVLRPFPDEIDVRLPGEPSEQVLAEIADVLNGRTQRAIDIEGAEGVALDVRESLIGLGLQASSLSAHRDDGLTGVVLRIRYRS